jgi:hypothetical protein
MWTFIKLGFAVVLVVGIVAVGSVVLNTAGMFITAPSRVISKTLGTDNIIYNYEWFHDTFAAYSAKMGQIDTHRTLVAGADAKEASRLRIELAAMQQTCRELATRYNANATKTNRSIFMGREAPPYLDMASCG